MQSLDYDFEIKEVIKQIKIAKAKKVLLQLPDGLKPYATSLINLLRKKSKADFFIWLGSNFGACDLPQVRDIDLNINFGHSSS